MKTIRINFSPIIGMSINKRFTDILKITVNEAGGIGGTRKEFIGKEIAKNDLGFMIVQTLIDSEVIHINPSFISTIEFINVTSVSFRHGNNNFPSGNRTEWYSHKCGTEIQFIDTDRSYPSPEQAERDEELKLKHLHTNNHNSI